MRTLVVTLLLLLLFPTAAGAQDRFTDLSIYVAGSSAMFDVAASAACRGAGTCQELNRFFPEHPLGQAAVKAAGNAAVVAILIKERKRHPKWVKVAAFSYTAFNIYLGVRAARTLK